MILAVTSLLSLRLRYGELLYNGVQVGGVFFGASNDGNLSHPSSQRPTSQEIRQIRPYEKALRWEISGQHSLHQCYNGNKWALAPRSEARVVECRGASCTTYEPKKGPIIR